MWGDDMGFAGLVMWACGALYLAPLAADVDMKGMGKGKAGLRGMVQSLAGRLPPGLR